VLGFLVFSGLRREMAPRKTANKTLLRKGLGKTDERQKVWPKKMVA